MYSFKLCVACHTYTNRSLLDAAPSKLGTIPPPAVARHLYHSAYFQARIYRCTLSYPPEWLASSRSSLSFIIDTIYSQAISKKAGKKVTPTAKKPGGGNNKVAKVRSVQTLGPWLLNYQVYRRIGKKVSRRNRSAYLT